MVNVAEILPIWMLPQVKYGFGSDATCRLMQSIECNLVSTGNETDLQFVEEQTRLYQVFCTDLSEKFDVKTVLMTLMEVRIK